MDEKIKAAVKTLFSKYGLKDASIEKIANIVKARVEAMGTIEPEKLDETINSSVKESEPFVAIIQSEADSRVRKPQEPTPPPAPAPAPADEIPAWAKSLIDDNKVLKDTLAATQKAESLSKLKAEALKAAQAKGAANATIAEKALRLVQITDESTAEQVADLLIKEYNDLYTATSGGAVPGVPKQQSLSEADLAKQREESAKKSKEELLKDKQY